VRKADFLAVEYEACPDFGLGPRGEGPGLRRGRLARVPEIVAGSSAAGEPQQRDEGD